MSAATGKGSAMHLVFIRRRFVSGPGSHPYLGREHIPEIRKLLRSNMSIREIAEQFSVQRPVMLRFIKQNRLCDVKERQRFISLQASLAREERLEASK